MNNREFDNIIKQSAQQRETDVPNDIWDNISAKKKKRRFPFFWLMLFVLLFGGTAIIWNIEGKNKTVLLAVDKKSNNNKRITTIGNNKNKIQVNNPGENINKNVVELPANVNNKIISANTFADLNKKNIPENNKTDKFVHLVGNAYKNKNSAKNRNRKNKIFFNAFKKQSAGSKADDQKNYSSSHKKQIRKGRSNINIRDGEIISSTDQPVNDNTNITINEASKISTQQASPVTKNNIETNSSTEIAANKIAVNDSDINKKIVQTIQDSTGKRTIASTKEKKKAKHINKGLIIEAGLTMAIPVQQYAQTLYVKRTINSTNAHAEFISDNIKSSVETGAGFNISLVKNVNKKWSVGTGGRYLRFTEILKMRGIETFTNYTIVQRLDSNAGGAFLKKDTVSTIRKNNTILNGRNVYTNVGIPLFVRYNFIKGKKWSVSVTAGIYVDVLRKYQNNIAGVFETTNTDGSKQTAVKNAIGLDLFAGLHFTGALYKRYEWFAGSSFSYDLNRYKANSLSFNKRIYMPAATIGIAYKFKK